MDIYFKKEDAVTRDQARRVLSRLLDGDDYPEWVITQALIATGDLDRSLEAGVRSEGLVAALPREWSYLVAGNDQTH